MHTPHPNVDALLARAKQWPAEQAALRHILLASPLTEDFKWGQPCYTLDGKNVAIIGCYKDGAALSFFKGTLLKDDKGLLQRIGQNTQSGRWIKFASLAEITRHQRDIKALIRQAIEVEKSGAKVVLKSVADYPVPAELTQKFKQHPSLKAAFQALTPGRQKAYLLHFGQAKQSKTRAERIERYAAKIFAGKGPLE